MLTKIPLGGVKCLACDKVITNYHGHVPEYKAWKKLPKDVERSTKVRINKIYICYSMDLDSLKYFRKWEETIHLRILQEKQIYRQQPYILILVGNMLLLMRNNMWRQWRIKVFMKIKSLIKRPAIISYQKLSKVSQLRNTIA